MRSRFCLAVLAMVLAMTPAFAQSRSTSTPRIDRLKQWMARVAQHQPGQVDDSVIDVRGWTRESLQDIRDDLYALRRLICVRSRKLEGRGFCQPPPVNTAGRILQQTTVGHRHQSNAREWAGTYSSNHLAALMELVPLVEPSLNVLLKRGALMHTAIALVVPPSAKWERTPVQRFLQQTIVRIVDGQESGVDQAVDHLAVGRRLLDIVTPDPLRDPFTYPERDSFVREWYRGTMALLVGNQGMQINHSRAALELFRDDAELLLLAGSMHEALSMPFYQRGVSTRRVGSMAFINTEEAELRQAERLFRQALKVNPRHAEARLRLGHVLGQRGHRDEALVELRAADALSSDALLSYYAALLIAREESALNHLDAARAAYRRAASVYPRAQSPHIGLSELESRDGNRYAAAQALEVVWAWGRGRDAAEDPWSNYPFAAGRDGPARLMVIAATLPPLSVAP